MDSIAKNATLANECLVQWVETRKGQLTATGGNQFAWLRDPSNSSIYFDVEDPAGSRVDVVTHGPFYGSECNWYLSLKSIIVNLARTMSKYSPFLNG